MLLFIALYFLFAIFAVILPDGVSYIIIWFNRLPESSKLKRDSKLNRTAIRMFYNYDMRIRSVYAIWVVCCTSGD